jgi:hypothetical protein
MPSVSAKTIAVRALRAEPPPKNDEAASMGGFFVWLTIAPAPIPVSGDGMAKTVQVTASAIGQNHVALVALRDDDSMWTIVFHQSEGKTMGPWVQLPAIPDDSDEVPGV